MGIFSVAVGALFFFLGVILGALGYTSVNYADALEARQAAKDTRKRAILLGIFLGGIGWYGTKALLGV